MSDNWITEEIEEELEERGRTKYRFLMPLIVALLVIIIAAVIVIIAGINADDFSVYADREIIVRGIKDEPLTITPAQLLEMDCVDVYTNGGTSKSEGINGTGPEIETFLAAYGKKLSDYKKIRFICADDNKFVLSGEYMTGQYQIVMSVKQLEHVLPRSQQPLRIIIPGGEPGKWAYGVLEIDFVE